MTVNGSSLPNLLLWLIIVVIFLVILFWILDRFLILSGGILTVVGDNYELPMISLNSLR